MMSKGPARSNDDDIMLVCMYHSFPVYSYVQVSVLQLFYQLVYPIVMPYHRNPLVINSDLVYLNIQKKCYDKKQSAPVELTDFYIETMATSFSEKMLSMWFIFHRFGWYGLRHSRIHFPFPVLTAVLNVNCLSHRYCH